MADSDQYNDEYQFADLDSIEPNAEEGEGASAEASSEEIPKKNDRKFLEPQNIKRNALIVVVGFFILIMLYKWLSSGTSPQKLVEPVPTPVTQPKEAIVPIVSETSQQKTLTENVASENQKISALELAEQNLRTDVSTINEQLATITNNLNTMNTKMVELNGIITNLSNKIDQQSREMEQKAVAQRQVKRAYYPSRHVHTPYNKYYIQAVIPGRAWLIAMNGTTLTVREGTVIPGYGMVKLIDSSQGRVLTSSGQIIKFSQNDS